MFTFRMAGRMACLRVTAIALAMTVAASLVSGGGAEAAKRKTAKLPAEDVATTDSASGPGLVQFDLFNDGDMSAGAVSLSFNAKYNPGEIIVSFGDRRLYYVDAKGHALAYPIAVPREDARWAGVTVISDKRINPAWTPTPHMLAKNPNLPSFVPGGHPMNPLGVRAMYLAGGEYRIHGTDAPWTIGTAASSGCVRMFNKDAIDLFNRAKVGARVTVTWDHFTS